MDQREARESLLVATRLEPLPRISEAVEAGQIYWRNLQLVLQRATPAIAVPFPIVVTYSGYRSTIPDRRVLPLCDGHIPKGIANWVIRLMASLSLRALKRSWCPG